MVTGLTRPATPAAHPPPGAADRVNPATAHKPTDKPTDRPPPAAVTPSAHNLLQLFLKKCNLPIDIYNNMRIIVNVNTNQHPPTAGSPQGQKANTMNNYRVEFFRGMREERSSYKDMIDFCCDSLILNNSIIEQLSEKGFYFDEYCGAQYDEETDEYTDIYQWFIIDEQGAERLARYTNEIVVYNEELDLYLLGVTHYGTAWQGVPENWKTVEAFAEMED